MLVMVDNYESIFYMYDSCLTRQFTLAPASKSTFSASLSPRSAATISGVYPETKLIKITMVQQVHLTL